MFRGFFTSSTEDERQASIYTAEPDREQPALLERVRGAVGLTPQEQSFRTVVADGVCPSLTFQQRLYGFAICFVLGCVVSLSSMMSYHQLLHGNPTPFAIKYSVGNALALGSSAFLVGPKRQLRNMSHPTRWVCALVYVGAIVGTVVFALVPPHSLPIVTACIVVQFLAMFWYCLSYIPYGRRMLMACCRSMADDG